VIDIDLQWGLVFLDLMREGWDVEEIGRIVNVDRSLVVELIDGAIKYEADKARQGVDYEGWGSNAIH
jgi:hypothetical protein